MSDFIRNKNSKPLPNSKPKKNNTRRVAISIIIFTIIGSILGFISFGWLIYGNFKQSSAVAYADDIITTWSYSSSMYCWYYDQPDIKGIKFKPDLSFNTDTYNFTMLHSPTVIDGSTYYNSFLESGFTYNISSVDNTQRFYQYYRFNTSYTCSLSTYDYDFTNRDSIVFGFDNVFNTSFDYTKGYLVNFDITNPSNRYENSSLNCYVYFTSYGSLPTVFDSVHIYNDTTTVLPVNRSNFIRFDYYSGGNLVFTIYVYNNFELMPYSGNGFSYSLTTRNHWRYFLNASDNADYNSGVSYGRSQGLIEGENIGYDKGYTDGNSSGYSDGFEAGRLKGIKDANDYSFIGLMSSVIDAPIQAFRGLFTFNVFGVDMTEFLLSIFSLCVVIAVIKMFV